MTSSPTPQAATPDYDVVLVGAGQAGLAVGYFLAQQPLRFVIVEAGSRLGSAWRGRWESLKLFTSRRYSGLPGMPFPGDPDSYAGRDEVADYLERYAREFSLPVELNSPVHELTPVDGRFRIGVDTRSLTADQVVVATGAFQTPYVPPFADQLAPEVAQMHSTGYQRVDEIPEGTVLVVGGGNTGFQIAEELSAARNVHLSIGSRQTPLPQRLLGRDIFWWLSQLGVFDKTTETRIGQRLKERLPLIGSSPRKIRQAGVTLRPRATTASGRTITFADGSTLDVDAVIWATGYRNDYSWVKAPIFDEQGRPRQRRGITEVPGLYFVGLEWQWTRGSALIGWVRSDAEFIAQQIAEKAHRSEASPGKDDGAETPTDPVEQGGSP
jgi:putative flavoprotein involved in K+ transport